MLASEWLFEICYQWALHHGTWHRCQLFVWIIVQVSIWENYISPWVIFCGVGHHWNLGLGSPVDSGPCQVSHSLGTAIYTWRNRVNIYLKVASLMARCHGTGMCFACCWRRKVTIKISQQWTLRATVMTSPRRHAHWFNSGSYIWEKLTTFWLDLRSIL